MPVPPTIPARLIFVPMDDPDSQRNGFGPDSIYFEYCILPLVGPSSCLLYRHVAPLIQVADSTQIDLAELGRNLGLGAKIGRNSAILKALARLEAFDLGAWRPDDHYALRRRVAPLTNRQAQRLPQLARSIHYQIVGPGSYPTPRRAAASRTGANR